MTRRTLLTMLLGAFRGPLQAGALPRLERRYRCDAVIILAGIPIYSRAGVGSGYSWIGQASDGDRRRMSFGFAAGSWPERAKGLNRLGCIQESVVESAAHPAEVSYFGFMTSSKEESAEEARKALASNSALMPVSAIRGSVGSSGCHSRIARLLVDKSMSWSNWHSLLPRVTKAFEPGGDPTENTSIDWSAPTFLYAVYRAIAAGRRTEEDFTYSGRRYRLAADVRPDPKTGRRLVARRLAAGEGGIRELSGKITGGRTNRTTRFRVWFDTASCSPLPLRIELQPKSFLRLIFESDPTLPPLDFPNLLASHAARPAD